MVGDAYPWTLDKGLAEAFTPEVREAWSVTYSIVAALMIAGADYPTAAGPEAKPKWWQTVFGAKTVIS